MENLWNEYVMKRPFILLIIFIILILAVLTIAFSFTKETYYNGPQTFYAADTHLPPPDYYTGINFDTLKSNDHLTVIPLKSIRQQVTDYTCGPVAAMNVMAFYGVNFSPDDADEFRIAREMNISTDGTSNETISLGLTPEQAALWFNRQGWNATWGTNGTIEMLRENLKSGHPVMVEWIDWGGHWVVVVGYDTRGSELFWDDVIIFADSVDCHDDRVDGITYFNAGEFDSMWFDSHYFPEGMKNRAYVIAKPG
jgi:hypothetical protein